MNSSGAKEDDDDHEHDDEMSDINLSELVDDSVLDLIDNPYNPNITSRLRTDYKYNGFDSSMGSTWIYPTNYPIRQYQFNISRTSLFKNTLVVLPTGLGKTFIASVVMYNIFRWYPKGKMIFMAPTRPLVAQQIDACYQIMGFPKEATVELTGKQNKKTRALAWQSKRVFYCTPQVVWSDMNDNDIKFPINDIKLIVVDEAHKAKGKYAYTEVVQSIWSRNKFFRVLALSATPGRAIKDVAEVVQNLLISNIEVRRESSIDVAPYVFKKNIKTVVVPLGEHLSEIKQRLQSLVEPYVRNLSDNQVISGTVNSLTKAWLLFDRGKFREATLANRHPNQSNIMSDFSVCIAMYHAIELLERHGIRVLLNYFDESGSGSNADEKYFVLKDSQIREFINDVRSTSNIFSVSDQDVSFYGHPKFEILQKCLLEHFQNNIETKAIVFCEYRETVFLIHRMMQPSEPLIKPRVFVGQGTTHNRTITQKEQIAIMNDFRSGKCNTLIATCVAEEGIDVGEVDFIVCFDVNNKNPIRFIQRIGRTGRKRQGKVAMLVTEGKEHQMLKEILATKDGINQKITKGSEVDSVLCKEQPRLVPPEFNPQCIETYIEIKNTQPPSAMKETKKKSEKPKRTKKESTKTPKKNSTKTIRKFFKPVLDELDDNITEIFDISNEKMNSSKELNESTLSDNNAFKGFGDITNEAEVQRQSSNVPLDVKLKAVFERYCDIMEKKENYPPKFDEFGEAIPASKLNTVSSLPLILKNFYVECDRKSTENHRKESNSWNELEREQKVNIFKMMFMLRYEQEKYDESLDKSKTLAEMKSIERSYENAGEKFGKENDLLYSQMAYQMDSDRLFKNEQHQHPTSSTPHKTLIFDHFTNTTLASPIAQSPLPKAIQPMPKSNLTGRRWPGMEFLGIKSVFELFTDNESEDEAESIAKEPSIQGAMLSSDSVFEASEYTVSRILKICDEDERNEQMQRDTSHDSPLKKRRLDIGSVSDLFTDDEDDMNCIQDSQFIDSSYVKNDKIRTPNSSNGTVIYDWNQAASISPNKSNIGGDKDKAQNSTVRLVTGQKSDDLFSTYNESTNNLSSNKNDHSTKCTPKKTQDSNLFVYHGSPSVLNRSLSTLNCYISQVTEPVSQISSNIPKTTTDLNEKLELLNSQLSTTKHLNEFDETKENFSSPYVSCRTANLPINNVNPNCDTDFTDDDLFVTCKVKSPVNKASVRQVKKHRAKRRRKLNFIDDEAGVSGDDSSEDDLIESQMSQMNVTDNIDEGDPSVDIQAKYLQSVRSPINRRPFRIPDIGYRIPNTAAQQNIFSQYVPPDDSQYMEDSFVVGSEEEEEAMTSNASGSDEKSTDFDEITIVSTSNNRKRKSDECKKPLAKKRRRIIQISSDSD